MTVATDGTKSFDIRHIAELARLDVDPGSLARLQRDMESIVAYIRELNEVDVSGVEPTVHAVPLTNVWREDVAETPPPRDGMLANAPALLHGNLIKVPQVLPGEGMN